MTDNPGLHLCTNSSVKIINHTFVMTPVKPRCVLSSTPVNLRRKDGWVNHSDAEKGLTSYWE